jgi:hypothetical protein
MFEEDGETLRIMRLFRLRDTLMYQIQYGLQEANRTGDMDLVRELELKVGEAHLVSNEIAELLKKGEVNGTTADN